MVVRVAQRAARAEGVDEVAVATDDERIASAVTQAGFRAVMTPSDCRNGTERIARAALELPASGYLNVQGDEPLVDPHAITELARLVRGGAGMATVARHLEPGEEDQPSVVKVVLDAKGRALYFSRSPDPLLRAAAGESAAASRTSASTASSAASSGSPRCPPAGWSGPRGLEQLRAL